MPNSIHRICVLCTSLIEVINCTFIDLPFAAPEDGSFFKKLSGIDPFTIDQLEHEEHFDSINESSIAKWTKKTDTKLFSTDDETEETEREERLFDESDESEDEEEPTKEKKEYLFGDESSDEDDEEEEEERDIYTMDPADLTVVLTHWVVWL